MSRVSQAEPGKYFLLVDNMLVVLGFLSCSPHLDPLCRSNGLGGINGWDCLGLRQFVQQGLGVFGGAIADRFGAKPMIVTGMLLRAAGFATMAIAHEPGCCGSPAFSPVSVARCLTRRAPRWW